MPSLGKHFTDELLVVSSCHIGLYFSSVRQRFVDIIFCPIDFYRLISF